MRSKLLPPTSISPFIKKQNWAKGTFYTLLSLITLWLAACGPVGSDQVPVTELPNPAIYALTIPELPEVGFLWQQTYNQTTTEQGYKWSYLAYQAYQPGGPGGELESALAVNNDVYLYEVNISREDLPQPPQALGTLQGISWKSATQLHRLGDKSALWKTTIGELLTPVWWLEFYQGHAYVRISLFGFPDQIAPAYIYELGDIIAARLPRSVDTLRSDASTQVLTPIAAPPTPLATALPTVSTPSPGSGPPAESVPTATITSSTIQPLGYTASPGETGMVTYFDDTGNQLVGDPLRK